jgi:hypothetical protein
MQNHLVFARFCCYFVDGIQMFEMKTKYKILIHVAFWVYMFNQTLLTLVMVKDKGYDGFQEYTIFPVTSLLTFYSLYFAYGLISQEKRKLIPVLSIILVFLALIPLRVGMEYIFWKYIGYSHMENPEKLEVTQHWWIYSLRLVIIYGIYALLIRLAIGWFDAQKLKSELIMEKQAGELALLRNQINPHFLFNTLNNIYSLVYKKSDDAPEAVMKMSAIMRYMLYDATTDKVLLEKEVEYLKSFIELEKLRLKHHDFVDLTITGTLEERTIAPMLLIHFVENAFKHGSKTMGSPGIWVKLTVEPGQIAFEVKNYARKGNESIKDLSKGIGLVNVRRRLNLLYPGKHRLEISEEAEMYCVNLTLMI